MATAGSGARSLGEAQASECIKPGSNGTAIGAPRRVLADDKSNTLYVCSDDFSGQRGIKIPGAAMATSLKLFDLKTGEPKGSIRRAGASDLVQ